MLARLMVATCHCGAVELRVPAGIKPISTSICHCDTCKKLSGAPFLVSVLLPAEDVTLTAANGSGEPELVDFQTSKHVTRRRCAACHSPVVAELGKSRYAIPLALFPRPHPEGWQPQHHMHYDHRVMDVSDDLPKYRTKFGSTFWTPSEATEQPCAE